MGEDENWRLGGKQGRDPHCCVYIWRKSANTIWVELLHVFLDVDELCSKKVFDILGRQFGNNLLVEHICRQVGSLKRQVRRHLGRWELKNCTPLWREAHFEVKSVKAHHARTTFGS